MQANEPSCHRLIERPPRSITEAYVYRLKKIDKLVVGTASYLRPFRESSALAFYLIAPSEFALLTTL